MIVHDIEQGSYEWFQLRCGKLTGSRLCRVFKSEYLKLIDEIIAEQLTETWDDSDYVSHKMQRGKDLEPVALDRYEGIKGVKLIRGGFIQSVKWPLLGYSPDGRVDNIGGVEVKCPDSKTHVTTLRQNQLPNDHKWQVLSSFLINPDLQWYDFMSFDPRVSQKPEFIFRTTREDVKDELATATIELDKFFKKMDEIKSKILF